MKKDELERTDLRTTRLAKFIAMEGISISKLSRVSDVNVTYICDLKAGRSEPTRRLMQKLLRGASEILGREVLVTEVFDFETAPNGKHSERAR